MWIWYLWVFYGGLCVWYCDWWTQYHGQIHHCKMASCCFYMFFVRTKQMRRICYYWAFSLSWFCYFELSQVAVIFSLVSKANWLLCPARYLAWVYDSDINALNSLALSKKVNDFPKYVKMFFQLPFFKISSKYDSISVCDEFGFCWSLQS